MSVTTVAEAVGLALFGIVMVTLACVGVLAVISLVLPKPAEPRVIRGPHDPGDEAEDAPEEALADDPLPSVDPGA